MLSFCSVRLTQLKLSGFKSFVDPTSIHVPGQLVGVVGPNGCGKSNVIDAVRWVLGESRASALRGDSMQDVIFNGSANRQPLARASVELVFDNSLGRAGGQWSQYAEISVRRVLQRDGESSYYINGTHVRRRDILDIFLGTGLGPRAYAIIEQGMISRVIEAKPEELRVFLEEAAGISKYKERRRETENRLADTRDNLARITDIRLELGAQLEKLEGQAQIASRYKEFQADLQLKQHLLWFLRRRDATAERERHAAELDNTTNALEAENAELRGIESRVETARAAHYAAGDALNTAQASLYGANAEVARLESELRHAEETRQRLEAQHTERRAQLGAWREQRAQLTLALHMWAARSGTAKDNVVRKKDALAAENAKLPQAEQAARTAQDTLDHKRSALLQAQSREQLEQANRAHLERAAQALGQRRERLEAELQTLEAPDVAASEALAARLSGLANAVAQAQARVEELQAECASLEEARTAAAEALAQAERDHAGAQAQLATLRQIQAAAGNDAKLRAWQDRHGLGSLPRLWQRLRIEHGWEAAVESVLRERLHAVEIDDAGRLAALLSDHPSTKTGIFSRGAASLSASPSELASKVQAADAALQGALADWLSGVLIVEGTPDASARAALPAGGVLVNRAGDQFTRHTVTFHAPDAGDAGVLSRQAEIEELDERCGVLERNLSSRKENLEKADGALAAGNAALESARGDVGA